jgi:dihydroorotate dehydrogenase electron transfer subunit
MTTTGAPGSRGPVHVRAEVVASRRLGAYRSLTLAAPGVPERFRPGNVVALSLGPERMARRSFWVHRVRPVGGLGATVEVVVEPRGPGSAWLAAQPEGSRLALTGPLGRPFALPREPVDCLLVGEGVAAAVLFPLAERLRERGCRVHLLLGARDEGHLLSALEARRTARSVTVVTADGSVGSRGELAPAVADQVARTAPDVVYAAGPAGTLHAVAAAAEAHGAWSQTAVEVRSACATGLCHGCPLPVVGEDGAPREVRACTEGPVVRGDRVRWAELVEDGTPR